MQAAVSNHGGPAVTVTSHAMKVHAMQLTRITFTMVLSVAAVAVVAVVTITTVIVIIEGVYKVIAQDENDPA